MPFVVVVPGAAVADRLRLAINIAHRAPPPIQVWEIAFTRKDAFDPLKCFRVRFRHCRASKECRISQHSIPSVNLNDMHFAIRRYLRRSSKPPSSSSDVHYFF